MTKSELAADLGVTTRTLYNWVKMFCHKHPDVFDFEVYRACRVLPPFIRFSLQNHFGV